MPKHNKFYGLYVVDSTYNGEGIGADDSDATAIVFLYTLKSSVAKYRRVVKSTSPRSAELSSLFTSRHLVGIGTSIQDPSSEDPKGTINEILVTYPYNGFPRQWYPVLTLSSIYAEKLTDLMKINTMMNTPFSVLGD